jgi:hypothetical protein
VDGIVQSGTVADAMVDATLGAPLNGMMGIAGPERMPLDKRRGPVLTPMQAAAARKREYAVAGRTLTHRNARHSYTMY